MMNPKLGRNFRNLLPFAWHHNQHRSHMFLSCSFTHHYSHPPLPFSAFGFHHSLYLLPKISSSFNLSFASHHHYSITTTINASSGDIHNEKPQELAQSDSNDQVEPEEAEPEIGDGGGVGGGGGVVIQNCPWGERAQSIAQDVLLQFGDDIEIFAFKISPRGRGSIYVRLDRLCNKFLSVADIQSYSHEYKKKLDEAGAVGDIPGDLALEVSSIDADRLLRIPDDLRRFKKMAMRVKYVEQHNPKSMKKEGIFFLESIEMDSGGCVWRLADVKENRLSKGRPLTRKQKDRRLKLPYEMLEQVTLYLD
ncbi:hypothetical protein L1987_72924 [Smallanthus sonchifolius]|uniref:Uncharacterized protein n=1 Tax=Smallanthus sonchifolius TaxID=185202 RepID=A0ACB9AWU0_9ASTR|nr:hypothetical protein L1987_72924 [Smallanthus sonchifolius]